MSSHRVASRTHSAVSICVVLALAGALWFALPAAVGATPVAGTGAVTDATEETLPDTGATTDPADEALPDTGGAIDPIEEAPPDTGGVTEPIEGALPDTGGVTDPIEEALPPTGGFTQPVKEIVEETLPGTGGTKDPVEDPAGYVKETVGSIEGGALDEITDTVTGPVVDSIDRTVGASADSPKDNNKANNQGGSAGSADDRTLAELFRHEFAAAPAGNPAPVLRIAPASAPAPSGPGLVERVAQAALDAAKKAAFPLALALIAAAFVVLQGRIDRRDPKLAAAPIEIDEQLLRFE